MIEHPMRSAPIHVFQRLDEQAGGTQFIARFYPYDTYPVFFHGQTEADAINGAERLRDEVIEKHEAAYIARKLATEKARASRAKKKDAK